MITTRLSVLSMIHQLPAALIYSPWCPVMGRVDPTGSLPNMTSILDVRISNLFLDNLRYLRREWEQKRSNSDALLLFQQCSIPFLVLDHFLLSTNVNQLTVKCRNARNSNSISISTSISLSISLSLSLTLSSLPISRYHSSTSNPSFIQSFIVFVLSLFLSDVEGA